jgi:hypothetical protein
MQEAGTLSMTEVELMAAAQGTQKMTFVKKVMESMNKRIKFPMKLKVDNKGTKDL